MLIQMVPPAPIPPEVSGGAPVGAILVIVLAGIAAVTLILIPLARAWARRLERGGSADSDTSVLARMEHLEQRLAEAEERLDFAERMLARAPESTMLPREKAD
ncbi:MAG TPA: hypothetical protein VFJ99_00910 [Solirubrobacterales bacterium]|nr:hypothetical protein [Solirubrobacterales bacterium]